ncbi:MAG: cellulase family glycosylhydrolase [Clostridia bacterium]|nr:cellulase family glycosylhydrolase [Clostridia bacterium]
MDIIRCSGTDFIDPSGRTRFFHGINLCDKGVMREDGKREYVRSWDEGIFESIRACGFNCVRLGITWDAVEPQPGVYDDDYIACVDATVKRLAEAGAYVYLDMHQDLYTGSDGGMGDGAPAWACMTGGREFRKPVAVWAEGYFLDKAVWNCFDAFWSNAVLPQTGRGLRDMYCDMLSHLAEKLGGNENILGWDVLNEPFPGTVGGKIFRRIVTGGVGALLFSRSIKPVKGIRLLLNEKTRREGMDLLSGRLLRKATSGGDELLEKFDREFYSPFMRACRDAVRKSTPRGVIFIEGDYWSNSSIPSGTQPIPEEPDQAFTPHGYDLMVDTPAYKYASDERVRTIFREHRKTQLRLGCPVLVGEWGGFSDGTEWLPHIKETLRMFDGYLWSDTYWCYYEGFFDSPVISVIKRPYPQAVDGKVKEYSYDCEKKELRLVFDSRGESETLIYLPAAPEKVEGAEGSSFDGRLLSLRCKEGRSEIRVTLQQQQGEDTGEGHDD